jgi:lipoteichoic acid synthase
MKRKAPSKAAPPAPKRPSVRIEIAALLEAALLGLVYAAQAIVFKGLELVQATGEASLSHVLRAAAADVALAIAFAVVFGVLLSKTHKALAVVVGAIGYALAAAMLVVTAASHGYFAATGSHLSLASLDVWASNMGETNNVIRGEALTWKLPLVIAQVAFVLAAAITFRVPPVRRRLARLGTPSRRAAVAVAIALAALLVAVIAARPLQGKGAGLCRAVPISMVAEAGRAIAESWCGDEGAIEEERPSDIAFEAKEGAPRPNIVVIMFESLNWKSSDVYVPGRNTTPFLAELAAQSLVVDREYTVVPHTSKAIVSILCGMTPYPGNKRIESTPGILPKQCMAHILRGQGYRTAYFQPAMDFEDRSTLVKNMGFETFRGLADLKTDGFEKTSYFGREDKIMVGPSLEWVDSVEDQPFFLAYMTLASHHNYVTPQSFPRVDYPETDPDQENYLNAIHYIDDVVREIIDGFKKRGLLDKTVFFIVGDHGEAFAEHARRQHDLIMWEEGLHTESLIYGPGLFPNPGHIEGLRSHLDLVPTVVDLLGLTPKNGSFEGTSLFKPVPDDRKLFHSCWFNNQCGALQEGPIKTIYHYESQPMEVYNDLVDEHETNDLAGEDMYGEAFLEPRKKEILDWKRGVEQRYRDWESGLTKGRVLTAPPRIAHEVSARFGDFIELVGYDVGPERLEAGGELRAKYVFKCLKAPPPGTDLFVHLMKDKGGVVNADHEPVGGAYPVPKWKPGEYIVDDHSIHIPADWSGDTVRLAIGYWNTRTKKRAVVSCDTLPIEDNRLVVADKKLEPRRGEAPVDEKAIRSKVAEWVGTARPEVGQAMGDVFGGVVELTGVTLRRTDVKLAGTVEADYVFHALGPVPADYKLSVSLVREDDGRTIKGDHEPIGGLYPPKMWRAGEYVVDRHSLHIDMYLSKTGRYGLWLGFTQNGRPVDVTGPSPTDTRKRVYLGAVTINPRTERQ